MFYNDSPSTAKLVRVTLFHVFQIATNYWSAFGSQDAVGARKRIRAAEPRLKKRMGAEEKINKVNIRHYTEFAAMPFLRLSATEKHVGTSSHCPP